MGRGERVRMKRARWGWRMGVLDWLVKVLSPMVVHWRNVPEPR